MSTTSKPLAAMRSAPAAGRVRPGAGYLRMLKNSPAASISAFWLLLLAVVAVVVPLFGTELANEQNLTYRFLPPFTLEHGLAFILGADSLGRPMLLQLVVGAQTTLIVAALTVGLSALVGAAVGILSGYFGGWVDSILMRLADIFQTIPSLLLALAVLYVLEPSIANLILVLAFTRLPVYLRTSRTQTLELRERVFVESSRSIGASRWRTMARDISPMVTPTIRTLSMLEVANVILAAASLSFLGIGLQRPDVDWGMMVADGRAYLETAWWATVLPGLAIAATALAANILSNWMRAVEDPTQSGMFLRAGRTARRTRRETGGAP